MISPECLHLSGTGRSPTDQIDDHRGEPKHAPTRQTLDEEAPIKGVELTGLEPVTPTLPVATHALTCDYAESAGQRGPIGRR